MSRIGMKYPTYAAEATYTAGTGITYSTGKIFAHAIEANVTPNRRDNRLWGDDEKIENDKGLTDYTIALTVDKVMEVSEASLLGETAATSGSSGCGSCSCCGSTSCISCGFNGGSAN